MAWVGAVTTQTQTDEERYAHRHHLSLTVRVSNGGSASRVVVHNLSATGLLIEADLALEVGDEFDVELPEAQTTRAEVVWRSDDFCGCEFVTPLSSAIVSASRLRSLPVEHVLPTPARMFPGGVGAISIETDPNALSPRQKLLVTGGLAVACWLPIILVVRVLLMH
jgi:hypothetical protein